MNSPSSGRALVAATLSSCALAFTACDPSPNLDDASVSDAGPPLDAPEVDAFSGPDPTAVHWEAVALPAEIPSVWGWSAANLGDGRTVVLGGAIGAYADTVLDRVLVLEPSDAGLSVTPIERPADAPSPRWCACATFDAARDRVLFAGGRSNDALEGIFGTTWELDVGTGAFTELAGTPTPAGVIGCALAYSAERRATYWFGGASSMAVGGPVYRLDADGTEWVALEATGPTPRYDVHFEALDERRLLLFGGAYGARGAAFYSDVWIFDTSTETWSEVVVEGDTPPGRRTPWLRLDADRGGFYAGFGYDGTMSPLGDLHHFDLARAEWTPITVPDPVPAARGFSAAVEASGGAIGLLLPGLLRTTTVRDAFVLVPNE